MISERKETDTVICFFIVIVLKEFFLERKEKEKTTDTVVCFGIFLWKNIFRQNIFDLIEKIIYNKIFRFITYLVVTKEDIFDRILLKENSIDFYFKQKEIFWKEYFREKYIRLVF